jgi:hypothetical protein
MVEEHQVGRKCIGAEIEKGQMECLDHVLSVTGATEGLRHDLMLRG